MIAFRRIALAMLCLLPLVTLVYQNDVHRWRFNRSVMIAPDEFSYLLTADAILHGPHISTQKTLGIDTFYPPGYPLILAAWALFFGLTPLAGHALNALLVSCATALVYLFARRLLPLLSAGEHRRFVWTQETCNWMALFIAAIFAANWHVLEGALFILSEPAFMLATFAWLALPLLWPDWHLDWRKTLAVGLLAIAAWSIRGAGIVCVAVTCLYPCVALLHQLLRKTGPSSPVKRCGPIALLIGLALLYQVAITLASPEKSLTSADAAANGYPHQLLNGITERGALAFAKPTDWPNLAVHVSDLALSHLNAYGEVFMPPFREPPDLQFRYFLAKLFGGLALLGFVGHLLRRNRATLFLVSYIAGYFVLYLLWPFNMPRFWGPILPVMLVYAVHAVREFWSARRRFTAPIAAVTLLGLLFLLSGQELVVQLGNFQRRINLVSASLAQSAATVERLSRNPQNTLIAVAGNDEHFIFAWYLPRVPGNKGAGFMPVSPGPGEQVEPFVLKQIIRFKADPTKRLFLISYFLGTDYPGMVADLRRKHPRQMAGIGMRRVFQNENITSVWELRRDTDRD